MTAARCPHRHYRTARYARRMAWSQEPDAARRSVPVECECGIGAWRLTSHDTPPVNENRPEMRER